MTLPSTGRLLTAARDTGVKTRISVNTARVASHPRRVRGPPTTSLTRRWL